MKFLVDESVEYRVIIFLRNLGYDTRSVVDSSYGLEDKTIVSLAYKENRILITNDKDFGELIYRLHLPHKGIILFRLSKETYQLKEKKLNYILKKFKDKLQNSFTVISDNKIRFRK